MIEGGLSYVYAAYAVTVVLLGGAALWTVLRAVRWARAARALDQGK